MPNLRSKTWTTTTPAYVEDAQYWEDHLISDAAAAKAASSVQSVNSTTPDANGNVDIVALPAGGTVGQVQLLIPHEIKLKGFGEFCICQPHSPP